MKYIAGFQPLKKAAHAAATTGFKIFAGGRRFSFEGAQIPYLYAFRNYTYLTERSVEVPIARWWLEQGDMSSVLEVGNVLQQYRPFAHDVVDKYEVAPGVMNSDVVEFAPAKKYSQIVSLSTLEHVGFDEPQKDPDKPAAAVGHLKLLLKPGGRMMISVPVGYNPAIDAGLRDNGFGFDRMLSLKRTNFSTWKQVSLGDALQSKYWDPYPYGNAVVFGIYERTERPASSNEQLATSN